MRAMNRGAAPPIDVRDPGVPEAICCTENLVLWEMLQSLAHFLARAGELFKGAPAGTDHQCTHHVGVSVDLWA